MAPTTIYFNGRLINKPGSYSEVNANDLSSPGLTASGIVAYLGTAIGGKPYSAINTSKSIRDQLQIATNPRKPYEFFRSGDLLEMGLMAYAASTDDDVNGSPQEIVFVKVNPATAAAATFSNVSGDAMELTAKNYGYFTNQIVVEIGDGTLQGKQITITFEDTEEIFDDVGGDSVFQIQYAATVPADGYDTITSEITTALIKSAFTAARAGLDSDITNQVATGLGFELVSSNAGDNQTVTVYGRDASDNAQSEALTVDGTTVVTSTKTWNAIDGAIISSAPTGTITIRNLSAGTTITTLASGNLDQGLRILSDFSVAKETISLVRSAAGTEYVVIVGASESGATQLEAVQLNGTTPVVTTGKWSRIDYIGAGELAAAGTVTLSGNAVNLPFAGNETVQKVADAYNGKPGFTFTINTNTPQLVMENMDVVSATNIKSPANPDFYADLYELINKINLESALVSAARSSGATGVPDNTTAPVFLSGGHEGSSTPGQEGVPTSTAADWQNALDILTKIRVNSIAVLTTDPAIHAKLKAHLQYMAGVGRSERDGAVGLENSGQTALATKSEIKSQITALGTRHLRAFSQNIEKYDSQGTLTTFGPQFGAGLLLAMQASTPVGTPLTKKTMDVISVESDSSWNPSDDVSEMLDYGLVFLETIDGIGHEVVRNLTTHKSSNNIAYIEASANEAVNYSVFNIRTALQFIVGQAGFRNSANLVKAEAEAQCANLLDVSITAYLSPTVELTLDVFEVGLSIAPVLPINFVKNNVHLISVPQVAA